MRLLVFAILAASLLASTATSRRCCPDEEVYMASERRCADTPAHKILNCSMGMYLLNNSGRDKFLLQDDDMLVKGRLHIEPDRYCVTRMLGRDSILGEEDVAFVCFPEQQWNQTAPVTAVGSAETKHTLMGVLIFISVGFMAAMLVVYALLPDMRDLEGKCLMTAVFNLCVAFLLLGILQLVGGGLKPTGCLSMAFSLYFWMLSAFFWLNVVSYNMWRMVVCSETSPSTALYVKYCVYAWGCPLVLLAVALVVDLLPGDITGDIVRPKFGHSTCWFHEDTSVWLYFYGPIAVLLGSNVVLFVWTAVTLWRQESRDGPSSLHSLRFKCVLYAKLFVIMGITWVFELVSHLADNEESYVWLATDILNALQGVLIFIVTVACRRRVLHGLSRHRTCGISWPKSWAAGVDAESHAILADTDVEMSSPAVDKILS